MSTLERHITLARADQLIKAGDYALAQELCDQLLRRNKHDLSVLRLKSTIAFNLGDFDAAESICSRCLTLLPKDPYAHFDLARVWAMQGKFDKALLGFEKAIRIKPDFIDAIADKADVLKRKGDDEAATALLRPHFESGTMSEPLFIILLRSAAHDKDLFAAVIRRAEEQIHQPVTDSISRVALLQELGRIYDRTGQYPQAFDVFSQAQRMGATPFNREAHVQKIELLMGMFTRENLRQLPRPSATSELPIFIACMPRSGSTLVEQILHAHPKMAGVGEHRWLDDCSKHLQTLIQSFQEYPACIADLRVAHLDELSREYLDLLTKMAPGAVRAVNKALRNYEQLGLAQLLFPNARIIHIRRDRIDNCFACYMAGLKSEVYPWASDLQNLGFVWRQYERLMLHWRENLDLPILDVEYEQLVEHTEREIRRIIDFCGVKWNDQCLRYWEVDRAVLTLSADQVRKPIFKSAVQRYKRYEEFLGPLKAALAGE